MKVIHRKVKLSFLRELEGEEGTQPCHLKIRTRVLERTSENE